MALDPSSLTVRCLLHPWRAIVVMLLACALMAAVLARIPAEASGEVRARRAESGELSPGTAPAPVVRTRPSVP